MYTIKALTHFVQNYEVLAYFVIFFGMVLEGELVVIFSGILVHLGALPMIPVLGLAYAGCAVKSISWYYMGVKFASLFSKNKFFSYMEKRIHYFLPYFKKKPFWSVFLSKFIYGINHLTLIFSGYTKINFKTYFKAELYSSVIWLIGVFSLGYFFSYAALGVSKDIRKFTIIILLFILGFILLEKLIAFLIEIFEDLKFKDNE